MTDEYTIDGLCDECAYAAPEYWKDYGFRALANWKKWSEED